MLAAVHRLPTGEDWFVADQRSLVKLGPGKRRADKQVNAWNLADPPGDFVADEVGCAHGTPSVDVAALRTALRGVSGRGAVHLL